MTPADIDRLAHMVACLRPDWPLSSLRTGLTGFADTDPHRTLHDTAHALVEIALDPKTKNPGRLAENGPWWKAAPGSEPQRKITMGTDAVICPKCRAVDLSMFDGVPHECLPTASDEARALAREAAVKARGEYERAMGARAEAQRATEDVA